MKNIKVALWIVALAIVSSGVRSSSIPRSLKMILRKRFAANSLLSEVSWTGLRSLPPASDCLPVSTAPRLRQRKAGTVSVGC